MKKKVWDITVVDNPNRAVAGEQDIFYTSDTEAFLVFQLTDKDFNPTSAMLSLNNRNDGSVVSEEVNVSDEGVIAWEMREEIIAHPGRWQAQLVYEQEKDGKPEKYTGQIVAFSVEGHLLDAKEPTLVEIKNWEKFIADASELMDGWGDLENLRQANEQQRKANEEERIANEEARAQAESERATKEIERNEKVETIEGLQKDLIDGAVDSAAVQQNVEARYGELESEYAENLGELKQNDEKLTAQLAQTYSKSTVSGDNVRPMVSFYLDDGYQNDYTIVLPKAQQLGIPFTSSLHDGSWVTRNTHALNEMLNAGWEFHAHTTHDQDLREATLEEKRETMRTNKELIEEVTGQRVTGVCYPGGFSDAEVLRVAREFFEVGMGSSYFGGNHYNSIPIDTYDIQRIHAVQTNLEKIKQDIDEMIAKGDGWLVIYGHSNQYPNTSSETLFEVMEYVKLKNVETVTVRDAMKVYGNKLDIGDWRWTDNYFKVGSTGEIDSNHIPIVTGKSDSETINDKLATDFPSGKLTIDLVSSTSDIPIGVGGGRLYTDRLSTRKEIVGSGGTQRYEDSRGVVATREFLGGEWTDWTTIGGTNLIKTKPYTVDSPLTDFPQGKITNVGFLSSEFGAVGTEGGTGSLIVNRTGTSNALHYQVFIPFDNDRLYKRRWSGGAWTDWVTFHPVREANFPSHEFGIIPANSSKSFTFVVNGDAQIQPITFTSAGQFFADGIIPVAHAISYSQIVLRLYNVTSSDIDLQSRRITFKY